MRYVKSLLTELKYYVTLTFRTRTALIAENVALRSQLSLFQEQLVNKKIKKPASSRLFRQIWIILSLICPEWENYLVIYKKATVVNWHKIAFKLFWTKKCKKIGRPPISKDIILKIKQLRIENPMMSAEKIIEMLLSLNIIDAPSANSVRKYIPTIKKTPTDLQRRSFSTF